MCLVLHSSTASRERLLVFVEAKDGQIENQVTGKNGLFELPPREIMHPNAQKNDGEDHEQHVCESVSGEEKQGMTFLDVCSGMTR